MTEMVRTHVVLPKELVDAIDALAGPRKRSEYVADILGAAVAEKLRRERVYAAALRAAGSIPEGAVPEWDTEESIRNWRRSLWGGSERTRQLEEWVREGELTDAPATTR